MKKLFDYLKVNGYIMLVALMFFSACDIIVPDARMGNGIVQTQTREVGSFNRIDVSGAIEVELSQGDASAVMIEADENLHPFIFTEVRGGELKIYTEGYLASSSAIKAYVTFVQLHQIDISGAVKVEGNNPFILEKLSINASGASKVELDVEAEKVMADLSGASRLFLRGTAVRFSSEGSGASKIEAFEFITDKADVNLSGASHAYIFAKQSLKADCSGASTVRYKGEPKELHINTSGASSVNKL